MPTGLTEGIPKGISFEQFVKICARQSLVYLRDDPADIPLRPPELSTYHKDGIKNTEKELETLRELTPEQAQEKADQWYKKEKSTWENIIAEARKVRKSYNEMRAKVEQWEPPTPSHKGLKSLMLDQIDRSIEFDCAEEIWQKRLSELVKPDGEQWKQEQIQKKEKELARHKEEWKEDQRRVKRTTDWLTQLMDSLASYEYIPEKTD